MHETRTIANWVANLRYEDIPEDVREHARRFILDNFGCWPRQRSFVDDRSQPELPSLGPGEPPRQGCIYMGGEIAQRRKNGVKPHCAIV